MAIAEKMLRCDRCEPFKEPEEVEQVVILLTNKPGDVKIRTMVYRGTIEDQALRIDGHTCDYLPRVGSPRSAASMAVRI